MLTGFPGERATSIVVACCSCSFTQATVKYVFCDLRLQSCAVCLWVCASVSTTFDRFVGPAYGRLPGVCSKNCERCIYCAYFSRWWLQPGLQTTCCEVVGVINCNLVLQTPRLVFTRKIAATYRIPQNTLAAA